MSRNGYTDPKPRPIPWPACICGMRHNWSTREMEVEGWRWRYCVRQCGALEVLVERPGAVAIWQRARPIALARKYAR